MRLSETLFIIPGILNKKYFAWIEIYIAMTLIKPKKTFWSSLIGMIGKKKTNIQTRVLKNDEIMRLMKFLRILTIGQD